MCFFNWSIFEGFTPAQLVSSLQSLAHFHAVGYAMKKVNKIDDLEVITWLYSASETKSKKLISVSNIVKDLVRFEDDVSTHTALLVISG